VEVLDFQAECTYKLLRSSALGSGVYWENIEEYHMDANESNAPYFEFSLPSESTFYSVLFESF
jgi:hypothetical protein